VTGRIAPRPQVGEFVAFSKPHHADEWHEVLGFHGDSVTVPVYSSDDRSRWVEKRPVLSIIEIRRASGKDGTAVKEAIGAPCTYVHGADYRAAYSWHTTWPTKLTAKSSSKPQAFPRG
jgi:hypothetical protein